MRKYLLALAFSVGLAIATPAAALANQTPGTGTVTPTTGQPGAPNNTCPTDGSAAPGNSGSSSNTGSPFNPNNVPPYAGNANTGSLHANSTVAISQYDSACFRP
jgi:hypothetical protein